jgi:hypothetical protein
MTSAPEVSDRSAVDAVIAAMLLAIFGAAYFVAQPWTFEARLVPQVICVLGAVSAAVRLAQMAATWRPRQHDPDAPRTHVVVSEVPVADPSELEPEVVFARASRSDWSRVGAWCVGFFVLLVVAGIYVAAAVFSLLYLRIEGKARTWHAALYAVLSVLIIYLVFNLLLTTPLPEGLGS